MGVTEMPKQSGGEASEETRARMGRNIRGARQKKKLTQRELGAIVGVEGQTVCDWEKGRHYPSAENLRKLAAALGETASFLVSDTLTGRDSLERLSRDVGVALGYNRLRALAAFPPDRLRRAVDALLGAYVAQHGELPKKASR